MKKAKLSPSKLLRSALEQELQLIERQRTTAAYLAELDEELGPATASEKKRTDAVMKRIRRHYEKRSLKRAS